MIIEFTISVIVPDPPDMDLQSNPAIIDQMDNMLALFEDEVGKANLELNDASWEAYD